MNTRIGKITLKHPTGPISDSRTKAKIRKTAQLMQEVRARAGEARG